MQGMKIFACYTRSVKKQQLNYTLVELELFLVVELRREYSTRPLAFP